MLTEDKSRATRRAGLLTVSVGKKRAFLCEAVDVGGTISHHAKVVTTEIRPTDVVAPDDQDVRFLLLLLCHLFSPFSSGFFLIPFWQMKPTLAIGLLSNTLYQLNMLFGGGDVS